MSEVPDVDASAEERGPKQKKERVRQHASVLDEGVRRRRPCWPFTFTLEDNRWYVNKGKTRSARKDSHDPEDDALL